MNVMQAVLAMSLVSAMACGWLNNEFSKHFNLNHILQKLEALNQYPDFNNYLIFVLTKLKTEGKFIIHYVICIAYKHPLR